MKTVLTAILVCGSVITSGASYVQSAWASDQWPLQVSQSKDGLPGNNGSTSPVFSPDGQQIAFVTWATNLACKSVSTRKNRAGIVVYDVPSATSRCLTLLHFKGSLTSYSDLSWSPDGKSLAINFNGSRAHRVDLFVLDAETGQARRLQPVAAVLKRYSELYSDPVWSPDSRRIAYTYRFNVRVTSASRPSSRPSLLGKGTGGGVDPQWISNTEVAFAGVRHSRSKIRLFKGRVGASAKARPIGRFTYDGWPFIAVAPGGRVAAVGDLEDTYIVDLKKGTRTKIPRLDHSQTCQWSSDGRLACDKFDTTNGTTRSNALTVYSPTDRSIRVVSPWYFSMDSPPAWSSDGSKLAWSSSTSFHSNSQVYLTSSS